jgi:uncharacterized membrane protein
VNVTHVTAIVIVVLLCLVDFVMGSVPLIGILLIVALFFKPLRVFMINQLKAIDEANLKFPT